MNVCMYPMIIHLNQLFLLLNAQLLQVLANFDTPKKSASTHHGDARFLLPTSPEEHRSYHDRFSTPIDCHAEDVDSLILERLFYDYKKDTIPTRYGTTAHVEMHINDIPSINELESAFVVDMMYSEMWTDRRLRFDNMDGASCIRNITLNLDYLNRIWTPNTCIVNSKTAVIHESPNPNVFLILYEDGRVWKNCRMMVKAPCDIDLRIFPFDVQTCTLVFESYSYNMRRVRLKWYEEAPLTLVKRPNLPDFNLILTKTEKEVVEYPNGNWDQLTATFVFQRRSGFFIMQAYVPTYMTIFVAWINFWMDPRDQLATRSTLAISAFLAITLQFGNILKNQPPVSYVKAMDVWMLGCISFLFFSLAELAVVSYILRQENRNKVTHPPAQHVLNAINRNCVDSPRKQSVLLVNHCGSPIECHSFDCHSISTIHKRSDASFNNGGTFMAAAPNSPVSLRTDGGSVTSMCPIDNNNSSQQQHLPQQQQQQQNQQQQHPHEQLHCESPHPLLSPEKQPTAQLHIPPLQQQQQHQTSTTTSPQQQQQQQHCYCCKCVNSTAHLTKSNAQQFISKMQIRELTSDDLAATWDYVSLTLFLPAFVVFNIVYWVWIYLATR